MYLIYKYASKYEMYLPEEFQGFDELMCNVYQYVFGCFVLPFGYKILHACNSWFSITPALGRKGEHHLQNV